MKKHYHVEGSHCGCYPEYNVAYANKDVAKDAFVDYLAELAESGMRFECLRADWETPDVCFLDRAEYSTFGVFFYACHDDGDVCREIYEGE